MYKHRNVSTQQYGRWGSSEDTNKTAPCNFSWFCTDPAQCKEFLQTRKGRSRRIDLDLVTETVMQETKLGRNTVCKISAQSDVEKFKITPINPRNREMLLPDEFVTLI